MPPAFPTSVTSVPAPAATRAPTLFGPLSALSLAILLPSLGTSIANVALPTLAAAFSASFPAVQWVVIGYLLATTTFIVSAGRLGDLAGRRRLLMAGIVLFAVASVAAGWAPTLWGLIVARTGQGLGAAFMMALAMAFVADTVPREKVGRAMGLLGTMSAVGTALGPSLGGLLIDTFGWRAIFLINVPGAVLAYDLARRHLPADRPNPNIDRPSFDHVGTAVLALTLAAYALAMTLGRGHLGLLNLGLLAVAVGSVVLFAFVELNARAPLVKLTMFRDPLLRAGLITGALVSTVIMTTLVVGPFYLSHALGLDARAVGFVLAVGPIVAALTGMPAGRVVDRWGAPRVTHLGLVGALIGSVLLAVTPISLGVPGYLVGMMVITAGYGFFQTANNTAVMKATRPEERGVVSGLLNLSRNLGLITGASLMGAIFAQAVGAIDLSFASPADLAFGLRTTFAVAAGLVALALCLSFASRALASRPARLTHFPEKSSPQPPLK